MSAADLTARRAAAASVLADYRELETAPLSRLPGREWMLRLAAELDGLLAAFDACHGAVSLGGGDSTVRQAFRDAIRWHQANPSSVSADQIALYRSVGRKLGIEADR
jgi:hypothetical protein